MCQLLPLSYKVVPYSKEQFLEISAKALPKLKISHFVGKEYGNREVIAM